MRESVTISRKKVKGNEGRFSELKREGIQLAQEISGDIWSDFNAHDPGVTILEQLCYALTELTFHADAEVADLLLNEDGFIDYQGQSLHHPEEVFPCRATTLTDLRKMLLDEVKEINNIWLSIKGSAATQGLPSESLHGLYYAEAIRSQNSSLDDDALAAKINVAYQRHRNLSEDLAGIKFLTARRCVLHAKVEVDNSQLAEALLAEIYFRCAEYVSGNIPLDSYQDRSADGASLEALFNGPLTMHGLFDLADDQIDSDEVLVSTLFTIINGLTGVAHIKALWLDLDGEKFYEALPRRSPDGILSLAFPANLESIEVELIRNGGALPISIDHLKKRYQEMCYQRDSQREIKQDFSVLYSLPRGEVKAIGRYTSIQESFPAIYGINRFGADSESNETIAKTRQLKSYLLFFDQVMANFNASCARLDRLYSADNSSHHSYGYDVISDETIADIGLIYPDEPGVMIANVLAKYDSYYERKSRVLDYLLALYGQKFTQKTLRYFNYYYQGNELDEVIVNNKIACLDAILTFDKDRAAGFNSSLPAWNRANVAGLQRRLSILLGFRHVECRSLTLPLVKFGLKVVTHDEYRALTGGSDALKMIDPSDISDYVVEGFFPIAYAPYDEAEAVMAVADNIDDFVPLKNNMISDALMQNGVALERYSVGSLAPDADYQMVFKSEAKKDWWYIGRNDTRCLAEDAIRQLHRFIIHLNIECEGLHLVEHLLLRPQKGGFYDDMPGIDQSQFYSSRISVIFPAWTARCHDPRFRRLAEDSVRMNCPAHVYAEIYWLDFDPMYLFEGLYKSWLDLRQVSHSSIDEIDGAAKELLKFLHTESCRGDE